MGRQTSMEMGAPTSTIFLICCLDTGLAKIEGLPPFGRRCRDRGCSQPQNAQARRKARLLFLRPSPPTQASLVAGFGHKKTPSICLGLSGVGGPKRIRTAVAAFAELSLATRPSDPFPSEGITVGSRIYESGVVWVSFCGDKFRKYGYNAGVKGLNVWVRFAT